MRTHGQTHPVRVRGRPARSVEPPAASEPDGYRHDPADPTPSVGGVPMPPGAGRLWPTAHRFKRGRRIRVQVSSGAFPRYARNPGTGEPLATATTLRAAGRRVQHGPEHPSAVILPVRAAS
ncbi:CocE/NonD family hydrolase C-terminal non-catalytic domain-containing protein [Streptomyces sp. DSM 40750]|uniref:CocE/NonD family hydrolase C-terminal non-catalytic domain-containing protein n=1 Tax=Streptomyces sp. DSM 40750 TaxID=2801030 RepID=UPI00214AE559|nr:CocE/NonD family hydrolase C-terminal non-catalytic domain-containing protein [Streptomyces sp. DSM 40750]UUU26480.1 hypothetical protein JIX55_43195 [Streptomyces sp. DSM 40750]